MRLTNSLNKPLGTAYHISSLHKGGNIPKCAQLEKLGLQKLIPPIPISILNGH